MESGVAGRSRDADFTAIPIEESPMHAWLVPPVLVPLLLGLVLVAFVVFRGF